MDFASLIKHDNYSAFVSKTIKGSSFEYTPKTDIVTTLGFHMNGDIISFHDDFTRGNTFKAFEFMTTERIGIKTLGMTTAGLYICVTSPSPKTTSMVGEFVDVAQGETYVVPLNNYAIVMPTVEAIAVAGKAFAHLFVNYEEREIIDSTAGVKILLFKIEDR